MIKYDFLIICIAGLLSSCIGGSYDKKLTDEYWLVGLDTTDPIHYNGMDSR